MSIIRRFKKDLGWYWEYKFFFLGGGGLLNIGLQLFQLMKKKQIIPHSFLNKIPNIKFNESSTLEFIFPIKKPTKKKDSFQYESAANSYLKLKYVYGVFLQLAPKFLYKKAARELSNKLTLINFF